jgi:hemerythrin
MQRSRMPAADNHLRDHDGVVALLHSTLAELRAGRRGAGREVAESLAAWFDHHSATMDAALALHMQQSAPKTQDGIPAVG